MTIQPSHPNNKAPHHQITYLLHRKESLKPIAQKLQCVADSPSRSKNDYTCNYWSGLIFDYSPSTWNTFFLRNNVMFCAGTLQDRVINRYQQKVKT